MKDDSLDFVTLSAEAVAVRKVGKISTESGNHAVPYVEVTANFGKYHSSVTNLTLHAARQLRNQLNDILGAEKT